MKLSQQVLLGLKRLGNQTLISDECFQKLTQSASSVLVKQSDTANLNLSDLCISKPDIVKESFASLLILLTESSRHNLEANKLMSILENYNLNVSRLKKICDIYESCKNSIQFSLRTIGTQYPQVTDVKWRLDFCIKSSSLEHESRPIYFIQIITEAAKRTHISEEQMVVKKYKFTCSLQQLQELVTKLRDATRLMQSIANPK